jgi:hypothetical protein
LALAPAWGQLATGDEAAALVEMGRKAALDYGKSLPDFICTQVVQREQDRRRGGNWQRLDILTIKLSFVEQMEQRQLVLVNGKETQRSYYELNGAVTGGEFGSMLRRIFEPASRAAFTWQRWTHERDLPAAVYTYRVDVARSDYDLGYGAPAMEQRVRVGFHGDVEMDRRTGEVLRFTYRAEGMPKDFLIQYSETTVDYSLANIGGKSYLLPSTSQTEMRSALVWARNRTEFREYRKFTADSTLTFGAERDQ